MQSSETEIFLAPLSREKLLDMAVKFYGCVATTKTANNAVEFGLQVLSEAERLADAWKVYKLCEMRGHVFEFEEDDAPMGAAVENGVWKIAGWKARKSDCSLCGATLSIKAKELM